MHACRAWLTATLLAVLAQSTANAADMSVIQYRGQRVLLIQDEKASAQLPRGGSIRSGDAKRFEAALRSAMPVSEVLLNSRGGSEPDGLEIGRIIRRSGLATRIPEGAMCASACADAFLGGVARRVDDGGRYGIHMATVVNSPDTVEKIYVEISKAFDARKGKLNHAQVRELIQLFEQLSAQAASRWALYVMQMGASPRIVEVGVKSAASEMTWLTRPQLIDLNVVNVDN